MSHSKTSFLQVLLFKTSYFSMLSPNNSSPSSSSSITGERSPRISCVSSNGLNGSGISPSKVTQEYTLNTTKEETGANYRLLSDKEKKRSNGQRITSSTTRTLATLFFFLETNNFKLLFIGTQSFFTSSRFAQSATVGKTGEVYQRSTRCRALGYRD